MQFSNFDLVILGCIGTTFLAIIIALFLLNKKTFMAKDAKAHLSAVGSIVADYNRRMKLIESPAGNYMHSLGSEGGKALLKLKRLINDAADLTREADALIRTNSFDCIAEAALLLSGTHPSQVHDNIPASQRRITVDQNWQAAVEELLQRVGRAIAYASKKSEQIGLPKQMQNRTTLQQLEEAGVDFSFDA
jgi:hypothetical protein